MTKEEQQSVLNRLFNESRLAYSPVLEKLLKFLADRHDHGASGVPAKLIAFDVFHARDPFEAESRVRQSILSLRNQLRRYFNEHPSGRTSPYRIEIVNRPGEGYKLEFIPHERPSPSLRVFLCHASGDKESVRQLHSKLARDGFLPWLDEQDILPGQDWEAEIKKAVRSSEVVLVCLSAASITKQGFVQKEIKMALDVADEKPDGTVYIIPLRLEECTVPERLKKWHWANFFEQDGYSRLVASLRARAAAQ